MLVCFTNGLTVLLSVAAVALAAVYPFMKRYTHLPQVVLGAAFSMAIPMAFSAVTGAVPPEAWLLFAANLCWTVAYDTEYAMVDRDDDLKIGIKSTAVLFGRADILMIVLLQLSTLALAGAGRCPPRVLGGFFWLGLGAMAAIFVYQFTLIRGRDRDRCFQAFLNNHWAGLVMFRWPGAVAVAGPLQRLRGAFPEAGPSKDEGKKGRMLRVIAHDQGPW